MLTSKMDMISALSSLVQLPGKDNRESGGGKSTQRGYKRLRLQIYRVAGIIWQGFFSFQVS